MNTSDKAESRSGAVRGVTVLSVWSNYTGVGSDIPSLTELKTQLQQGKGSSLAKAQANAQRLIGRKSL